MEAENMTETINVTLFLGQMNNSKNKTKTIGIITQAICMNYIEKIVPNLTQLTCRDKKNEFLSKCLCQQLLLVI